MLTLVRAVAPSQEPVTLAEVKQQTRVDMTTDDALLTALIAAARELVEERTWRALVTQRWDLYLDDWPADDTIRLPRPPLRSVVEVEYTNDAGQTAIVSSSAYVVDAASEPGRLRLKATQSWPAVTLSELSGIRIRFEAGYGAAAAVPQRYKQAILLLVGHWYETREAILSSGAIPKEVPFAVSALLNLDSAKEF